MNTSKIDLPAALTHLLDLLAVPGQSGQEAQITTAITTKLLEAGCAKNWITTDDASERLGDGFEIGNLIIKLPGTVNAPRILFSAHMDTVPLCRGAKPCIQDERVVPKGNTGLGGDDRSGCAAMVVLAETLLKNNLPHPPLTLLFTIAEENGLHGSRTVRANDLDFPTMGFNLDGQEPNELVIGAMSAARWTAEITGRSSHAGLEPHKGISAGLIAARAMTSIAEQGFFGRIVHNGQRGTANLGTIHGGEANNQVMDRAVLTGECRSHDPAFLQRILEVHRTCFAQAAESVVNEAGSPGHVDFRTDHSYRAFRLDESEPCVQIAAQAVEAAGLAPHPLVMDAGLDANNFNEAGIPVVTLGTGSHNFHTVDEYVNIREFETACSVLLNIASLCAGTK